jgi:hypothetical protein
MKHDVHRLHHEHQVVMPYLLQWGCTTEGCLRHCSNTTHHCGLGTHWTGAPGVRYRFHRLVLSEAEDIQRLVSTSLRWDWTARQWPLFSPWVPSFVQLARLRSPGHLQKLGPHRFYPAGPPDAGVGVSSPGGIPSMGARTSSLSRMEGLNKSCMNTPRGE